MLNSILTDSVGLIGGGRVLRVNNAGMYWSFIVIYVLGIAITLFNLKRIYSNKNNNKQNGDI